MPSGRIAYNKKTVFAINNFRIAKTVYVDSTIKCN